LVFVRIDVLAGNTAKDRQAAEQRSACQLNPLPQEPNAELPSLFDKVRQVSSDKAMYDASSGYNTLSRLYG
jgi:hypothetical protein